MRRRVLHARAPWHALALILFVLLGGVARGSPAPCAVLDAPAQVAGCALAMSLEVRGARAVLRAAEGRRRAAAVLLPAHPTASLSLAQRAPSAGGEAAPVLNWYLSLSQEIPIAGQRGARLRVADAALQAELRRVAVAEQEAVAAALGAYYDVLAAQGELRVGLAAGAVGEALRGLAEGRERVALLSPVDADVARAEAARIALARSAAERRLGASRAVLSSLLGRPLPDSVAGELAQVPPPPSDPPEVLVERALGLRGEVAAADLEQRMRLARVDLLRRERVPNLTLSFLAQRDGFDERVLGGGLSLPLYLPAPLGPGGAGEVQAARAEAEQAQAAAAVLRRRVREEVLRALAAERSYAAELPLVPAALEARARGHLDALARAIAARQVPLRDALLSQRSLLDLIEAALRSRAGLAAARVELRRAAGLPILGGAP